MLMTARTGQARNRYRSPSRRRNGRPVAVVLSTDDLEAIEETLAILSDPAAMREIKQGRAAIASGDVVTMDEIETLRTQLRSKTA